LLFRIYRETFRVFRLLRFNSTDAPYQGRYSAGKLTASARPCPSVSGVPQHGDHDRAALTGIFASQTKTRRQTHNKLHRHRAHSAHGRGAAMAAGTGKIWM
jgi:hypothetical protein